MVKAVYGLKDAPRAWRKKLDIVLRQWGLFPAKADEQIYIAHHKYPASSGSGNPKLKMILSTHVDDLKGVARKVDAESLLAHLEKSVGGCSQEWDNFLHTGIRHEKTSAGVYAHQHEFCLNVIRF